MEIKGLLVTGLGEGAFFMSKGHYKKEIKKMLGFEAYPGTFNIKSEDAPKFGRLKNIIIEGYESGGKKFGRLVCYIAKLKNIEGAIIIPEFTRHDKKIIEFIAPVYLRSELKLKDGDAIKITVGI